MLLALKKTHRGEALQLPHSLGQGTRFSPQPFSQLHVSPRPSWLLRSTLLQVSLSPSPPRDAPAIPISSFLFPSLRLQVSAGPQRAL